MKRFAYGVVFLLVLMAPISALGAQPPWEVVQQKDDATIYAYDVGQPVFVGAQVNSRPVHGGLVLYAGMAMTMNGFPVDATLLTYLGTDSADTARFELRQGSVPFGKQDEYLRVLNADRPAAVDLARQVSTAALCTRRWRLDEERVYEVVAPVPSTIRLRGLAYDVNVELSQSEQGLRGELVNARP